MFCNLLLWLTVFCEEHDAGSQRTVAVSLCKVSLCNTEGNVSNMHEYKSAAWKEEERFYTDKCKGEDCSLLFLLKLKKLT